MRKTSHPLMLLFLLVVFAFIGGTFIASIGITIGRTNSALIKIATWKRMPVEIIESSVESVHFPARNRRDVARTYYRPRVTYRYVVNGITYTGNRVTAGDQHAGHEWAAELAGQYAAGQRAEGYYNPDQPRESFLTAEIHPADVLSGLFLVLLVLIPGYICVRLARGLWRWMLGPEPPPRGLTSRERRKRRAEIARAEQGYAIDIPNRLSGGILMGVALMLTLLGFSLEHWTAIIPGAFLGGLGYFLWRIGDL